MSKLSKTFSLISAVCAILLLSFVFYYICITTQKAVLRSCISSVVGDVAEYSNEIGDFARNGENWYVLTDDEAKSVLSNKHLTFGGCFQLKSQPQDMKEKNLKIAVRKNSEYGYSIMVWSKGFDNISGTEDDIVSPSDEKVPN